MELLVRYERGLGLQEERGGRGGSIVRSGGCDVEWERRVAILQPAPSRRCCAHTHWRAKELLEKNSASQTKRSTHRTEAAALDVTAARLAMPAVECTAVEEIIASSIVCCACVRDSAACCELLFAFFEGRFVFSESRKQRITLQPTRSASDGVERAQGILGTFALYPKSFDGTFRFSLERSPRLHLPSPLTLIHT